jgi:hypothetical protein
MNSLGRDLKKGDKVVLRGGQTFVCNGEGFGCFEVCSGGAIFGELNGENCRIEGVQIDAKATMRTYGAENGWQKTPSATEK